MSKQPSKKGLESKRMRYGYTFVAHWVLGLILFFAYPLISSVKYGFSDVKIEPGAITSGYVGLKHFHKLLAVDPNYLTDLRNSLGMIFYSLPIIIAISLILAVLLNQKYHGRTFFRAIFFLPVIMSTSVVMNILSGEFVTIPLFSTGESGTGIIDYKEILTNLNVPSALTPVLTFLLSNTISLVWNCGVQTILFLAGLQSIPDSLYEVSKIEGANRWEEFWWITVPSLRNIISLVMIYTMIDLFSDMKNEVVSSAYGLMVGQEFGESSARLWFYFLIVIIVIGTVYGLYQRLCVKRWE